MAVVLSQGKEEIAGKTAKRLIPFAPTVVVSSLFYDVEADKNIRS